MSLKRQESFRKLGQLLPGPALRIPSPARAGAAGIGALQRERSQTERLLQARRLTPRVWSRAGGRGTSGAKQSLLHLQRPAGRRLPLPRNKNPPFSIPEPSLLLTPGAFASAAGEEMRACWLRHTRAGPMDQDLVCGACHHLPAEGRGAAPERWRFGLPLKGRCDPRANREHPAQQLAHPQ